MARRFAGTKPIAPEGKLFTKPAPMGGLNARDGIANMPETDAPLLINFIPDVNGVRARYGWKEWATTLGDIPVRSILSYFAADDLFPGGSFLTAPTVMPGGLFACTDDDIFDITTSADSPTSVHTLSGTTYAGQISSVMMSNAAGAFLLAASEIDGMLMYDGTVWTAPVAGAGAGEINGTDPANFVHVSTWKRRAWFVERDSSSAWYLAADAIAGTVTEFDFGALFKRGGSLSFTASWTIDAGEGIDDFFVAVSSNGEVLVYKGTDPSSASTFALVGSWSVGQVPVGRRAYTQYGGDLLIATTEGVAPLSLVTRGGTTTLQTSSGEYWTKIRSAFSAAMSASFTSYGWQLLLFPAQRVMICSVPDYSGSINKQYALSTNVNQWCEFNDIPIISMCLVGGHVIAGTADGRAIILFTALRDGVEIDDANESTGDFVACKTVLAFSYFGTPVQVKQYLMVRPSFLSTERPAYNVIINTNFRVLLPQQPAAAPSVNGSAWGTGLWGTAMWGGTPRSFSEWRTVNGTGFAGAASMYVRCLGGTTLASIDYMLKAGGPL